MIQRDRDAHLINAAREVHHDDPEFGYRFICDELAERAGRHHVNLLHRRPNDLTIGSQSAAQRPRPAWPGRTPWCTPTGRQFRSHVYVRALREAQLGGSMGRVGGCQDNAAMESSLSLPQKNVLNRRRSSSRDELRLAIVIWIEKTYHRRRRQDRLGRFTPVDFEALGHTAHAA